MSVLKIKRTDGTWYTVEGSFTSTVVQSLPATGQEGVLYLVPQTSGIYTGHLWKQVDGIYKWCTFGGQGSAPVTDVQIDGQSIVVSGVANIPLGNYSTTTQMNTAIANHHDSTKQDTISDLSAIRSGAQAGATAVQPSAISDMATKTWTGQQGYATQTWVGQQDYATKTWTGQQGYATQTWVQGQDYATETYVDNHHDSTKYDASNPSGFITSASISGKEDSSNKTTVLNAQSTNVQYPGAKVVYDSLEDIREIAEGKSKNYTIDATVNPAFDSWDAQLTMASFVDLNGITVTYNDVKIGDNVYVTDTEIPDRWISAVGTSNMTLNILETARVPVTDVKINNTSILSNTIADMTTEKGIVSNGATIGLTQAFYDYLDNATYAKPTIASFNIKNSSGTNVNGDYELGSSVSVAKISHNETNIQSIAGTLSIKKGSTAIKTCAPASSATEVVLDSAQTITSNTTFSITGVDTKSNTISASKSINFYRYAYTTVNSSSSAPTTGLTKKTAEGTFHNNGADITYAIGDYIYLYRTTSGLTVETQALGQWASVAFTELPATTITQANGVTYTYYPYRVGPMEGAGTAKYRV